MAQWVWLRGCHTRTVLPGSGCGPLQDINNLSHALMLKEAVHEHVRRRLRSEEGHLR
jgi:hypothetical protein